MNILMTGGTGFIGSRFVEALSEQDHHIYVLTRSPKTHTDTTNISYISYDYPISRLPFIHTMVNLAGEPLFGYWTEDKKAEIVDSRLLATEKLMNILMKMETKPDTFITASAIGYYGANNDAIYTEKTETPGDDFLAKVSAKWESAAHTAEDLNIRTIYARFGLVLDKDEGALPMMALPFRFGLGGKVGDGEQYISWIHIHDCINLLLHALRNESVHGPINVTAPKPVQNKEFSNILAKQLSRPAIVDLPDAAMKLALGEMSQLITKGQYVLPQKAKDTGYTFRYRYIEDALKSIYK